MFDLEKALAAWRRSLEHNRTFLADDLDELEQHVRDQVAGLRAAGYPAEDAFARAMRDMGSYAATEAEYGKVYWRKRRRRHLLRDELAWRLAMLRNYLTTTWRNAWRYRGYSFINVTGLAVGLAGCLLIFLYVRDELRYDAHHERADRIYRVVNRHHSEGAVSHRAVTPSALGPALAAFPEVEHAVRFYGLGRQLVTAGDRAFSEEHGYLADAAVLDVFSFPLLEGDAATALSVPGTVVLTEAAARRYFGGAAPSAGPSRSTTGSTSW